MINESLFCVVNNEDNDDYDLDVSDDMKELSDIDEHPTATLLMEVAKKTQWEACFTVAAEAISVCSTLLFALQSMSPVLLCNMLLPI